jgi:predicted dehydrogenase
MIRVGLIGFGFMGQTHWRCYEKLKDHAKIVAVADIDPRRRAGDITGTWGNLGEGAQKVDFTGVAGLADWKELIARKDVDMVDICVPTPLHAEMAIGALGAGKHVLCEKPLARTLQQAQAIASAAKQASGYFMPAMCIRFWPEWAWVKQAITEKRYGKVLSASFLRQATVPPGWYGDGKQSGGALLDLHVHDTDFVCFLFGKPKAVSSRGYVKMSGAIDHINTHYHFDDVPCVVADGGWGFTPPYAFRMRYTVNFENATADYDLARPDPLIVFEKGEAKPVKCEAIDGWLGEIGYFLKCIAEKTRPTTVTADDAALAVQVCEAEARSVSRGTMEAIS